MPCVCPSHKFTGKSEKLLWFSLPKKAVCSPWQPFPGVSGCQERGAKFTELSFVLSSLRVLYFPAPPLFEGMEAGLQHYLK